MMSYRVQYDLHIAHNHANEINITNNDDDNNDNDSDNDNGIIIITTIIIIIAVQLIMIARYCVDEDNTAFNHYGAMHCDVMQYKTMH